MSNPTQKQISLSAWITKNDIQASASPSSPNKREEEFAGPGWRSWNVVFSRPVLNSERKITIRFHMGPALEREPTAEDVLSCVALDAAGTENARNLADWMSDCGFDQEDRLKAAETYKATLDQTKKLRSWLDDKLFDELVWRVDTDI